MTLAIEATGLAKDFEKGRRTHLAAAAARARPARDASGPSTGSTSAWPRARSSASSGRTARARRPRCGCWRPSSSRRRARPRVLGFDLVTGARDIRRRLGAVLSGERSLYWKLTARENLEYFAALYHVPPRETATRIARILEQVHLTDRADDYVEKFSTGMRQRLVLARALLPEPSLLMLDEPTVGLDPQAARDLRERVLQLRDEGRTVLLTTHYMEEADQLCDRIAIVDHGRIVALDTPEGLKRGLHAAEVVRLEVTAPDGRRCGPRRTRGGRRPGDPARAHQRLPPPHRALHLGARPRPDRHRRRP